MIGAGDVPVETALEQAGLPALPRLAWLAIDLDRIAANLGALRAAVPAGVRIDPVVKADGYGHGAVPVAHRLVEAGADGLCVATFDEAAELRSARLDAPLLVLYPIPPDCVTEAARLRIAVSAGDENGLARLLGALDAAGSGPTLEVHLEIETGLGRGGIVPERAAAAGRALAAHPRVELAGAWSHLGTADDRTRTTGQGEALDLAAMLIAAEGASIQRWHLGASGAILAGAARGAEGIRPGLSIYGVVPDGLAVDPARLAAALALRPAMSLRARPVRVLDVPSGQAISYGATFTTARPSRIATLPVGYADGYSRNRSNRASVLVRGRRVPLVGTIAMDAVMADVTDVPGPPVGIDDEFVLLGVQGSEAIDALELARLGTTISWEVLSTMARRLPRVYYAAAGPIGLLTLTEEQGPWRTAHSTPARSPAAESTP